MPIDRTTPVGRAAPIYRLTAHRLDRTRSMGRRPPSETRPPADKLIVTTPSSRSMARMGTDRRQKSDTDQAGIRPNTPSFPTKSRQDPSTNPADTSQKRGRHLARSQHEADTFSTRLKRFFSRLSSAPAQAHRSPRGHRGKRGRVPAASDVFALAGASLSAGTKAAASTARTLMREQARHRRESARYSKRIRPVGKADPPTKANA